MLLLLFPNVMQFCSVHKLITHCSSQGAKLFLDRVSYYQYSRTIWTSLPLLPERCSFHREERHVRSEAVQKYTPVIRCAPGHGAQLWVKEHH